MCSQVVAQELVEKVTEVRGELAEAVEGRAAAEERLASALAKQGALEEAEAAQHHHRRAAEEQGQRLAAANADLEERLRSAHM